MKARRNCLLVVALAALLGACTTAVPLTMPSGPVPDLRGTWKGTWGGTPSRTAWGVERETHPRSGARDGQRGADDADARRRAPAGRRPDIANELGAAGTRGARSPDAPGSRRVPPL